jgi:hypothetical protein
MSALTRANAQHYAPGSEGIKAASVPLSGFYIKDYNSFYTSEEWTSDISPSSSDLDFFKYEQNFRLIWITPFQIARANYGIAIRIPFSYREANLPKNSDPDIPPGPFPGPFPGDLKSSRQHHFGLGDLELEPVNLSWHLKRFDLSAGYSIWVPTGDYDKNRPMILNSGRGHWTHMFTAGATFFFDAEKTWAISALNRYEIHTEQFRRDYYYVTPQGAVSLGTTPGDSYTLEWAISKTLLNRLELGIAGYYQQQTTDPEGPSSEVTKHFHVAGIGPEIGVEWPEMKLNGGLRYAHEFSAFEHTQGDQIVFTLSKGF